VSEREELLCLKETCIYRYTCTKWLMNIPDDNEDDMLLVMKPDTKKYTCYVSMDGQEVL